MKKIILSFLIAVLFQPVAYGAATANIEIHVRGATADNRYYVCLYNVGCLSVLAGERGNVFHNYGEIQMDNIFLRDVRNHLLAPQGLPKSCDQKVEPKQTIQIYGTIVNSIPLKIANLSCSLKK